MDGRYIYISFTLGYSLLVCLRKVFTSTFWQIGYKKTPQGYSLEDSHCGTLQSLLYLFIAFIQL